MTDREKLIELLKGSGVAFPISTADHLLANGVAVLPCEIVDIVEHFKDEYERATKTNYVRNPLAYALYNVWRMADSERRHNQPTDLTGKCGSCAFAVPNEKAFGGSRCYVECTNKEHLEQYCHRHDISKLRQRTTKACRRYKIREGGVGND